MRRHVDRQEWCRQIQMTDIIDYIMGDYAQTATDTALLDVRYHLHLEEIARMRGKRLMRCSWICAIFSSDQ